MVSRRIQNQLARPEAAARRVGQRFILVALVFASLGLRTPPRHSALSAEPAAGASTATSSGSASDAVLEQRLREEAPKAWVELEQFYRHMSGSYSNSCILFPENKTVGHSDRGDFALNGDLVKEVHVAHKKNIDLERVMVKNDLYAFSISRRAGDPHARFAIEWLEKLGADSRSDKEIAFHAGQTEAVVSWPWRINGRSLPQWLKTPPFAIQGVTRADSGTTAMVRVDFEGMRVGPDTDPSVLSGYALFDPSDHWVVRECLTRWPKGGTRDAVFEYARRQDGFPIFTKRFEKRGKETRYVTDTLSLEVQHETVPASEFRLSYYGLPEPSFASPARHWLLWLFVNLGVVCVAIAVFLWWRRRKAGLTG